MTDMDFYWELVSCMEAIGVTIARAYFLCRFVKPFLRNKKYTALAGISYAAVMLVFVFWLRDVTDMMLVYAVGVAGAFLTVYLIDRRNPEQKIFLAAVFYLLKWITWGIALAPWQILYELLFWTLGGTGSDLVQFVIYAVMELADIAMHCFGMWFCIRLIHREYRYKAENMTGRELALMLAPLLSVISGQWIFQYAVSTYEKDTGQYIWLEHYGYSLFQAAFLLVSFAAVLVVIVSYQRIRSSQRKEMEDAVLAGQIEDMKRHIGEVEKLYQTIRGLRHDMGNHVMTLEKLCGENEAAGEYLKQWKEQVGGAAPEMKSGNPVTDVILREKQKEAEDRGIAFESRFCFPEDAEVSAFDVSVILNNALNNAIEAAGECGNGFVSVCSYQKKNAWLIEVRNSAAGERRVDEESGLPFSTKAGTEHGFGLANVRRAAQKYYGEIAVEQEAGVFGLTVMLMV